MKTEIVPASQFDKRVEKLMKSGYSIVSQGDVGTVFQTKKNSTANVIGLLGIISCITIVGLPLGIPLVLLALVLKAFEGPHHKQILLRKS